jgi:hypothetical protein
MMALIPRCSDMSKIAYHERSAHWLAIAPAPPDLPMVDPNVRQRKNGTLFQQSTMKATKLQESWRTVVHYLRLTSQTSLQISSKDNRLFSLILGFRVLTKQWRPIALGENWTAYIVAAEGGSEIIKTPLDPKEPYLITASRNIVAIYFVPICH